MCWKKEDELYNNGGAFKLTCRDESGVIVTLIADNYFGYCKKEVKTQISYAANLFGLCEEEHAGGALVFPSYDLGEEFSGDVHVKQLGHTFAEVATRYGAMLDVKPEGYGVDKKFPEIIYIPHDAHFDLQLQKVSWLKDGAEHSIKLQPDKTYVRPSGYKVRMEKPGENRAWRLVGIAAEGLMCHKPCTVSGGGKSEISKPITDAILTGPVFVADLKRDFDQVEELIHRDYSGRFLDTAKKDSRDVLAAERSLGSVIKLLTPDTREFNPAYNAWVETVPQYVKELVFVVKRYYKPVWGNDWRSHFTVDIINGVPGNELKCDNTHARDDAAARGFRAGRPLAHVRPAQGFSSRRQGPGGGRHHRVRAGAARERGKFVRNGQGADAQVRQELRTAAVPAAGRRHSSRLRQADGIRFRAARQFLFQLRTAAREDGGGVHRERHPVPPVHRADAGDSSAKWPRPASRIFLCPPPTRASWTASRAKIRATCRNVPTSSIRWKVISRKWARGCAAACRSASSCRRRSTPFCPDAATIRPNPASARSRVTTRFIFSSCRNCSWNSSAA